MSGNPTMNDVARQANVALKTVSRYVNGENNIDPVLVGRIQYAITQLGYRRNLAAASIRPGWTSKTIGLIISDLANPYFATLARAIERTVTAHGYMLNTASSDEDGRWHDRLAERMMEQRVDGLLIVPPRSPGRSWADVVAPVPPLVFLDRPADIDGYTVLADNRGGAREATQALIAAGARRLAFVGDSLEIYTMRERFEGYAEAVRSAGLTINESATINAAHSSEQAEAAVVGLLARADIDAVFAANNRASFGALRAYRAQGRRLPTIGFDDFESASVVSPPFSVVEQSVALMGEIAATAVLELISGDIPSHRTQTIPTTLRLRGSELAD